MQGSYSFYASVTAAFVGAGGGVCTQDSSGMLSCSFGASPPPVQAFAPPCAAERPAVVTPTASCPGAAQGAPAPSCLAAYLCGRVNAVMWVQPVPSAPAYRVNYRGAGWTLAMRVGDWDGFRYDSPLWTNTTLVSADPSTAPVAAYAKLQPFVDTPLQSILLVNTIAGVEFVELDVGNQSSLLEMFSSGAYIPTNAGRAAWLALFPGSVPENNCNREGINVQEGWAIRIGIAYNNENDCFTQARWLVRGWTSERAVRHSQDFGHWAVGGLPRQYLRR